jgi:hypothetical protein
VTLILKLIDPHPIYFQNGSINNINFHDQYEEKKRAQAAKQPSEKFTQPVQA